DDPVRKYLPYFHMKDPVADAEITVRDLLCHRSGITRCGMLSMANKATREEVARQLAQAEPWAPFRTRFLYNNEMYLTAGAALAKAAGSTWEQQLTSRLVQPLGMTSTHTSAEAMRKDPNAAKGYAWEAERNAYKPLQVRALDTIAAAGAINSNVMDMSRW